MDIIFTKIWWALPVFAVLAMMEYAIGIEHSRLLANNPRLSVTLPEEAPQWRLFSKKRLLTVLLACVIYLLVYFLLPAEFFRFVFGGHLLLMITECLRSIRFLFFFSLARAGKGIEGNLKLSWWYVYREMSMEHFIFAILYLLAFSVSRELIFGGAAAYYYYRAVHLWLTSNRQEDKPDLSAPTEEKQPADV